MTSSCSSVALSTRFIFRPVPYPIPLIIIAHNGKCRNPQFYRQLTISSNWTPVLTRTARREVMPLWRFPSSPTVFAFVGIIVPHPKCIIAMILLHFPSRTTPYAFRTVHHRFVIFQTQRQCYEYINTFRSVSCAVCIFLYAIYRHIKLLFYVCAIHPSCL